MGIKVFVKIGTAVMRNGNGEKKLTPLFAEADKLGAFRCNRKRGGAVFGERLRSSPQYTPPANGQTDCDINALMPKAACAEE